LSLAAIVSLAWAYNLNWHYSEHPVEKFGFSLNAIFWAGVVGIFCMRKQFNIFFFRWLSLAGKYSYGIYIFHYPIWKYAQKLMRDEVYADRAGLIKALAIILSIGCAVASYELYEKYFIRLKPSFGNSSRLAKR
jgi:peptidoglycan/LPS O-acetylase OafA/YrhL